MTNHLWQIRKSYLRGKDLLIQNFISEYSSMEEVFSQMCEAIAETAILIGVENDSPVGEMSDGSFVIEGKAGIATINFANGYTEEEMIKAGLIDGPIKLDEKAWKGILQF